MTRCVTVRSDGDGKIVKVGDLPVGAYFMRGDYLYVKVGKYDPCNESIVVCLNSFESAPQIDMNNNYVGELVELINFIIRK